MGSYKNENRKGSLADLVSNGFSELQSLAEECREIVDNASEGLQQTQRIQTFESTADALESLSEPDVPDACSDIEVEYTEMVQKRKGRGTSRSTRCSNAVSMLSGCVSALEQHISDLNDKKNEIEEMNEAEIKKQKDDNPDFKDAEEIDNDISEAESLKDELDSAVSEAENCEFPGMYG